jgi:NAD(P)-dependent dehydrogenase (short-subunit alcohol dehydrogenase family)
LVSAEAVDMAGKVCLVTGARSGVGRATATGLARMGATVVMVCRDRARGEEARAGVAAESGSGSVELMTADLSSLSSVRALAAAVAERHPRLDVLVNSAAVFTSKRFSTSEGLELMFVTNYLGPFLLTRSLLPNLEAARPSRVVNVSAPSSMRPDLRDLQGEAKFRPIVAFGASKAADLLFTFALARKLAGSGVAVNAYHPGLVRTGLLRRAPVAVRVVSAVLNVFMGVSPRRASLGLVELASSPAFEGTTGALVRNGKAMSSPLVSDIEAQDALWHASCALTGLQEEVS